MAALSTNRVAWSYTDDLGNVWRVAAQQALVSQGVQGGAAALATVPPKPFGLRMRRMTVHDGAGHSRTVVIYDGTATLKTPGTTINVNVLENSTAMTSFGSLIAEHRPRISVTTQSS
jgi:hypothetical protein